MSQSAKSAAARFMDDPQWFESIPEIKPGGPRCGLPAHEDCTPLDPEKTADHLRPGGTLGDFPGYEERPGQIDALRAVTRAFNGRLHLMIEAGTGVGKSLAYLVPAVHWSYVNDTPVVVSTATRNLQSQLLASDLPRAARTLGGEAPKLRFTVLKGRSNYLCLRALAEFMQAGYWTLAADEKSEFDLFVPWLQRTQDGDLDDFGGGVLRPHLICPGEDCGGRSCPFHSRCFVAKARERARRAHVVVANHALVLSEAANPGSGLLPAYGRLIFDEAHDLADVATDFFSFEFSRAELSQVLGRLSRPARTRRGRAGAHRRGALGAVERQLEKGALQGAAEAEEVRELVGRATVQLGFATAAGEDLLAALKPMLAVAKGVETLRYRTVDGVRQYARADIFDNFPPSFDESALTAALTRFESVCASLQGVVAHLAETLTRVDDGGLPLFGDLALQLQGAAALLGTFVLETKCVVAANDPERVAWVESVVGKTTGGKRGAKSVRAVSAPLSVAAEMKRCFHEVKDSVVMCSATLRTGDRFDYMARKLGLSEYGADRLVSLVAASPFDYFRQVLALAPDGLPDPSGDGVAYVERLAPFLARVFSASRGRGLVLFTAHDMLRRTAAAARPLFDELGVELLVQGDELTRESMVQRLKQAERPTVLFGAQSFWEGVDVPGEALSCVVLARLPFPQAGEPLVAARCARIVEEGGSAFRDFMVPEAVIRFRQGFGRLVRTKSDRGVVVIADPRIVTKNYGAIFRKAVPASIHAVRAAGETELRVAEFFA